MTEHIYKDNLIIQYGKTSFLATALDADGEPITSLKRTLTDAKKWIDSLVKL